MEPRIRSLINPTLLENDSAPNSNPLPSVASVRPVPVEPNYVADNSQNRRGKAFHEPLYDPPAISKTRTPGRLQPIRPRPTSRTFEVNATENIHKSSQLLEKSKHAVPIARVLNTPAQAEQNVSTRAGLDTILNDSPRKKRRVEESYGPETSGEVGHAKSGIQNNNSSVVTLPKPQPQPLKKKGPRRLPPLLQGLHHPPPDAGLFPRITEKEEGHGRKVPAKHTPAKGKDEAQRSVQSHELKNSSGNGKFITSEIEKTGEEGGVAKVDKDVRKKAKRNKWTDEETADLLKGVAKFGIGNWKRILTFEDFKFHGRTAVDLKDRFRTCRPSDYRREIPADVPKGGTPPSKNTESASQTIETPLGMTQSVKSKRKPRSGTHRKNAVDLAQIGIEEPFTKNKRRERRPFTEREDEDLLKGYKKHGYKWHKISSDQSLNLSSRQPADLRDRFRNKHPDVYNAVDSETQSKLATNRNEQATINLEDVPKLSIAKESASAIQTSVDATKSLATKPAFSLQDHLEPLMTNFPDQYFTPSINGDAAEDLSPITLSRNILGWADTHVPMPSLGYPFSSANNDQNPTITSTVPNVSSGINMSMLIRNESFFPGHHSSNTSVTNTAPSFNKAGFSQLPSLSTLSFPSSVNNRNSILNLPYPSGISSAPLDTDGRAENHGSSASLWDETTFQS